ncbi:MAG: cytochrome-c peroxidase, partial [Pseudomonadota bacterium]|nr:cytochrome-c peroxidase [Pseudomonadota bacterium]
MKNRLLNTLLASSLALSLIGCEENSSNQLNFEKTAYEPTILSNAIESSRTKYNQPLPNVEDLKLNKAKVDLGNRLYHDTRLSGNGKLSCASCHGLAIGGDDNMAVATGIDGQQGPI